MSRKKNRASGGRGELAVKFQTGFIIAAFLLSIAAIIWNASELRHVLLESTVLYVEDVAYQQASGITARFEADSQTLEQIADQISYLEEDQLEAYLMEKKAEIGFDQLLVWSRQELSGMNFEGNKDVHNSMQAVLEGDISVFYGEKQQAYFAVPVYGQEDKIDSVLVGVREKSSMQSMIQPKSFSGEGLSCIVNPYGEVVLSPKELKPFLQLDDIFSEGADSQTVEKIQQMEQDMPQNQSGAFAFTAVDGTELILSYQPIQVNDWILLTLVPAELIAESADAYTVRTFLIIALIVAVSAWLLAMIIMAFRRNRKQLEENAYTDPLTGGMNLTAFREKCRQLLEQNPPGSYTVILLNMRGFKMVNEFFGTSVGDDLLRYVSHILRRSVFSQELTARGEADNFFLCLRESRQEATRRRLKGILEELSHFENLPDRHYPLDFRLGAYLVEDPSVDITIIQDRVRIASQQQRQSEKCTFFTQELTDALKREQKLMGRFEQALENGEFQVYLQPKVRLRDGRIGGAEALVRWIEPGGKMISPGEFIPVFERNGSICKLDLYMFRQVCRLMRRWMEEGRPIIPVSVNLSRMHFRDPDFLQPYAGLKEEYGIPDGLLELEVTESIFFDDAQIQLVKQSIGRVHACGLKCSLDDFGMGFSSLGLLKEFDVDAIKMDRRFFDDMDSEKSWKVIESFMELPGKLGITAVAEGIETEHQLELLRRTDCDMVQGYVFSKPLSVEEFEQWWEAHA